MDSVLAAGAHCLLQFILAMPKSTAFRGLMDDYNAFCRVLAMRAQTMDLALTAAV
jgi:hypothetical protein